jgi:hypothetical protein
MAKARILEDTFEQLVELGQSTAKKSAQQVTQTFNPLKLAESTLGQENSQNSLNSSTEKLKNKKDNHTPLDFDKLQKKFQDKEKIKTEALRNRLFQMVRQGDEKLLMEYRQKEIEKKRRAEWEKQEKKRQEEEKKKKSTGLIPKGKVRRSIFSVKKIADRSHAEIRPATGKQ